jgi:hypothetical protein
LSKERPKTWNQKSWGRKLRHQGWHTRYH